MKNLVRRFVVPGRLLRAVSCRRSLGLSFTALLVVSGMVTVPGKMLAEVPQEEAAEEIFSRQVQPLLEQYCFDCHGNGEAEGNVVLDSYGATRDLRKGQTVWRKVVQQLQVRGMPPADTAQPADEQRRFLIGWIERTLNNIDCGLEAQPGWVTLRRLNRFEYRNTIRDLLGVDYEPAADFPADHEGYGFDNIGDVLSLPPVLMEKYLLAAEAITDQVVPVVWSPFPLIVGKPGAELQGGGAFSGPDRILAAQGEMSIEIEIPAAGIYQYSVIAYGHQAGDEPVKMAIRLNDHEVERFRVETTGQSPQLFRARQQMHSGKHKFAVVFLNDYYRPGADRNLIVRRIEIRGPINKPVGIDNPSESQLRPREVAEVILARWASQAYRRPVTESEIERLLELFRLAGGQGDDFQQSIRFALRAVLVSPYFLFRIEADPPQGESIKILSDYELAARLSYFLWSSMPDDELTMIAANGTLREPGVLDTQVRRMLRDSKSDRFIENFGGQWLNLRNLAVVDPDPELFPEFDDALRESMFEETKLFFQAVIREDRSVLDFIDGDFTYLNERLALHYGIADIHGDEFRRVELVSAERGGVLTHGSILTITSNPNRTSPVKRGKWILENILGKGVPPPPAGVEALEEGDAKRLSESLRERMEQHRAKPICASCHQLMDPIGFGFENFDAVGAWRDLDGEFPINSSGTLVSGKSFQSPAQLRILLKEQNGQDFCRCLAEKLLIYGVGRGLEYYDRCEVDEILENLSANEYRFSDLILGVVHSKPFQQRGSPH